MLWCGKIYEWRLQASFRFLYSFSRSTKIIKKGVELIIIFLGNGIVFVIVTLCTLNGQAQEGRSEGFNAIDDVFVKTLLW